MNTLHQSSIPSAGALRAAIAAWELAASDTTFATVTDANRHLAAIIDRETGVVELTAALHLALPELEADWEAVKGDTGTGAGVKAALKAVRAALAHHEGQTPAAPDQSEIVRKLHAELDAMVFRFAHTAEGSPEDAEAIDSARAVLAATGSAAHGPPPVSVSPEVAALRRARPFVHRLATQCDDAEAQDLLAAIDAMLGNGD